MRTILILSVLLVAACTTGADDDRDPAEDCARVREHVADLRLIAADPAGRLSADERNQHRSALLAASRAAPDECAKAHTADEIACLLAAPTLDSLRTCTAATED